MTKRRIDWQPRFPKKTSTSEVQFTETTKGAESMRVVVLFSRQGSKSRLIWGAGKDA